MTMPMLSKACLTERMTSNGECVVIVVVSIAPRWIAMGAFGPSIRVKRCESTLYKGAPPTTERGLSLSSSTFKNIVGNSPGDGGLGKKTWQNISFSGTHVSNTCLRGRQH